MSEHEDQWLRDAFATRPAARAEAEVDADRIWDAVRGEARPGEVEALALRMAEDPGLAEDWRLAMAAKREMETLEAPSESSPRGAVRWLWAAGVAAAAALVVLMTRSTPPPSSDRPTELRGKSSEVVWGPNVGETTRSRVLRWRAIPDATGYRIQIFDARLTPLHESPELIETTYAIPREFTGSLRWQIRATLGGGDVVRSPTFTVELR
ncbi:MAG: hypothetical protein AAF721_36315 [Myxococcota bacterium]